MSQPDVCVPRGTERKSMIRTRTAMRRMGWSRGSGVALNLAFSLCWNCRSLAAVLRHRKVPVARTRPNIPRTAPRDRPAGLALMRHRAPTFSSYFLVFLFSCPHGPFPSIVNPMYIKYYFSLMYIVLSSSHMLSLLEFDGQSPLGETPSCCSCARAGARYKFRAITMLFP